MNKWLIREEAETDERYGCYPHKRPVDMLLKYGMVVLDKPRGPTSNQVVAWLKEILNIKKAGQTGTLDPNASGVLVILLENSVKLAPLFSRKDKEYVALMKLHGDVDESKIRHVMRSFEGVVEQIPPKRSAVARKPRKRKIHKIEVLEMDGRYVLFRVRCEAGTYIRTLCVDIGKKLGINAHLQELRRTRVGEIGEEKACTLHDIADAYALWLERGDESLLRNCVLPVEFGLKGIRGVMIKDSAVNAVCNGAQLHVGGVSKLSEGIEKGNLIAVYTLKGEVVAIGVAEMSTKEIIKKRKGIAVRIQRVIMDKDTYPTAWRKADGNGG